MKPPVTHEVDADGVGWIIFDDPNSSANVFNLDTFDALDSAISALTSPSVKAVVVVSGKERIFIAGADLKWVVGLADAELAEEFSRNGQHLFQRLGTMLVPVVSAIHGACAGGGYELALACRWRIASDALATHIGLPEVGIGTIPGWGGCVRLPRLIGVQAALDHILAAQLLSSDEALKAGLVDEIVAASEIRIRAKAKALKLASGRPPSRYVHGFPTPEYYTEMREAVRRKTAGNLPAPLAAIDVIENGFRFDLDFALRAEAVAFGKVTAGKVCKNLVNGFFLREAAKKRTLEGWFPVPPERPDPIRIVGVVGAGVMGSGVAHWLAASGYEVILRDVTPDLVEAAGKLIKVLFDDGVKRGRMSAEDAAVAYSRITMTTGWDGFFRCDLVIEAIIENVSAKQSLFAEMSALVRPDTILASNTSSLPIEEIARDASRPERTIGIHFFNPVRRMALVELVIGRHTDAQTAERSLGFVKSLGKLPVICRSSPGFLVTRVLFFYLNEAVKLWEKGVSTAVVDAAMREFGWPMGPLRLIDEVGVDVTEFIFGELARHFPGRFARSRACSAMLAAGLRGRKNGTGSGFYTYSGGRESLNDEVTRSLAKPVGMMACNPRETAAALMMVMVEEARRCLEERVVLTQSDIDFALVAGTGFPAFRGGLMRYAARTGGESPFV
ncbi:MAG TPA: 3-hydroxyacyl-CoA dehydrogenase NAD-binding domain-containing protein [Opitutaceae bacterium]